MPPTPNQRKHHLRRLTITVEVSYDVTAQRWDYVAYKSAPGRPKECIEYTYDFGQPCMASVLTTTNAFGACLEAHLLSNSGLQELLPF